jgi:hypothetical protein
MWESRAAFWLDFSKRQWESALFADFHGSGISSRPFAVPSLPTNFTEDPIFLRRRMYRSLPRVRGDRPLQS